MGHEFIYFLPYDVREPFEQREEIIRCCDCKHLAEMMDGYECERSSGEYHWAEPNGFCAWAERVD